MQYVGQLVSIFSLVEFQKFWIISQRKFLIMNYDSRFREHIFDLNLPLPLYTTQLIFLTKKLIFKI